MKNKYPIPFNYCIRCRQYFVGKVIKFCEQCNNPIKIRDYAYNEHEETMLNNKKLFHEDKINLDEFNRRNSEHEVQIDDGQYIPIEDFTLNLLIHKALTSSRLIQFKNEHGNTSVNVSVKRIEYLNREDVSCDYYKLGNLHEMVINNQDMDTINKFLTGRKQVIGCILETNDYWEHGNEKLTLPQESEVLISPDVEDYWDLEVQFKERKIRELELARERARQQSIKKQNEKFWSKRSRAIDLHNKKYRGILSLFKPKFREAQCYRCNEYLYSSTHSTCSKCNWMICSCGACGCQFMKSY